jgi:hypothetical protein
MARYSFAFGSTDTIRMDGHAWVPDDPVMPTQVELEERSRALFQAAHWNVAFTGVIHFLGNPAKIYLRPLIAIREGNEQFGKALTEPDYGTHGAQQRSQARPDLLSDSAGLLISGSAQSKTLFHPNLSSSGRDGMLYGRDVREPLAGHAQICGEVKHPIEACAGFAVVKREVSCLITCNSRTCNSSKFFGQSVNLSAQRREVALRADKAQGTSTSAFLGSGNMPMEWMSLVAEVMARDLGDILPLPSLKKRVFTGVHLEEGDAPRAGSKPIQKPVVIPPPPPL